MTIYEILKHEIKRLNTIRLPLTELSAIQQLSVVITDLEQCLKAIEQAESRAKAELRREDNDVTIEPIDAPNGVMPAEPAEETSPIIEG